MADCLANARAYPDSHLDIVTHSNTDLHFNQYRDRYADLRSGLLHSLGHTDVLDLGGLATARGTEMYLALWVRAMGALGTPLFNIRVVR